MSYIVIDPEAPAPEVEAKLNRVEAGGYEQAGRYGRHYLYQKPVRPAVADKPEQLVFQRGYRVLVFSPREKELAVSLEHHGLFFCGLELRDTAEVEQLGKTILAAAEWMRANEKQ